MRAYLFLNACRGSELLDQVENHYPAQPASSPIQEQDICVFFMNFLEFVARVVQVNPNKLDGHTADWDNALLVILSNDTDDA